MRRIDLLALLFLPLLASCLEMDGFLADAEDVGDYLLPGNTIPAGLIDPVTFDSQGNTLYGFWVASNGERPGITILYCHGNKHSIDQYWDRVMFLHELGVNLFIFDYRGFGRSEGAFSEGAMLADARAAMGYVLTRPEVTAASLALYGYSLGNVASIYLAAEVIDPLFLVAEAPFASANSLAQGALNLPLPARWLTGSRFDNAARISGINTPLLVLHGADDDFVRFRDNGRVIFERAPEPKALRLVPRASHEDVPQTMGLEAYRILLKDWIDVGVTRRGG